MQQSAELYAEKEKDLHIYTCKGQPFYLAHPTFDIEEIAHSTGMQCRYCGHTSRFFSVAEHAVLVEKLVRTVRECDGGDPFEGLMHDAHEAYVSDIASPWKAAIPDYKRVEAALELQCRRWIGLSDKISDAVKFADWLALFIEAEQLMKPGTTRDWLQPQPGTRDLALSLLHRGGFTVACFDPVTARNYFLDSFARYRRIRDYVRDTEAV